MPKACKVPARGSDAGKYNFAKTSGATITYSRKSYASMIVPTVLAIIARRSCRLCSTSESGPAAIPVVVIVFLPAAERSQKQPFVPRHAEAVEGLFAGDVSDPGEMNKDE